MDHIYDIFNDIEPTLNDEKLTNKDELLAQKLSALDYLSQNDLDNAIEVLFDIEEKQDLNKDEQVI